MPGNNYDTTNLWGIAPGKRKSRTSRIYRETRKNHSDMPGLSNTSPQNLHTPPLAGAIKLFF